MEKFLKEYDLDIDSDFNEYLSIWRSGTSRRPHDHPQYMRLMRADKQRSRALVYFENSQAKIIYPFYLASIAESGFPEFVASENKHMISAYGYGGAAFLSNAGADALAFEKLLEGYIEENKIISEFVREDLFFDFKVPRRFSGVKQQDNVVVNLRRAHDDLWTSYKHSVRKNINRAMSSGLEVVFDFSGQMTDEFVRVYHLTMARTGAKQSFIISLEDFNALNAYFAEDEIGFYVHILLGGKVVATELVLRSPRNLYSFLGGADIECSNLRPSDLLKHEVNTWAINNGVSGYVLGGGVKPYDGIYNFKLAFDQGGAHPFFLQRNIHDGAAYEEMIYARKSSARGGGDSWEPNPDFFPAYLS